MVIQTGQNYHTADEARLNCSVDCVLQVKNEAHWVNSKT